MKNVILPIVIILQLFCGGGLLYAQDLETHRAFKVTSYDLGAIENFQGNSSAVSRTFHPLLITSTVADILNSEYERTVIPGDSSSSVSNLSSLAMSVQFDATNNIYVYILIGEIELSSSLQHCN